MPLVRAHNGCELIERHGSTGTHVPVQMHRYNGRRFKVDWALWLEADRDDPSEFFPKPPLVPFGIASSIILLHPTQRRPDGDPALIEMTSDSGSLGDPLPATPTALLLNAILKELDFVSRSV